MTSTEIVLSVLLSDLPTESEQPTLLRALGLVEREVDPDFADTVASGYVESDAKFGVRIGGRP